VPRLSRIKSICGTWLLINDLAALQVSEKMAEPDADMDALMTRMDTLQTQIEAADGWELERQLERAMDALRCPAGDISFPRDFGML
jgi:ATPase subunit of ABC transporter with duplicated ATPase domains